MGWMLSDALVIGATWLFVSAVVSAVTLQLFNTKRSGTVCSQSSTHQYFRSGPQLHSMDHHWTTVFSSRVGNWRLTSHPCMYVWHSIIPSLTCMMAPWPWMCVVCGMFVGMRSGFGSPPLRTERWVPLYVRCKSWLSYMWLSVREYPPPNPNPNPNIED